ncbi:ComEC/Rec2 family competence protein [Microbacterium aoyamense]|uniref:ComEC/Rec2 family competence protein n=1 Tax=Microbacterium aoyamense TaxID=344166 RepID=A0ABP5AFP7_9MICO|nr:ComEC/Rec2 family competence protein [Microbacterium aoyamense]
MFRRGLHLVPVVAAGWATAYAAIQIPDAAPGLAVGGWAIALCALAATAVVRRRRAPVLRAIVVLTLAAAASGAAASHVAYAQPARVQATSLGLDGGRAIDAKATVVGKIERRADGSVGFDAVASQITTGSHTTPVRVEVSVVVDPAGVEGSPGALDVGSTVVVRGTAEPGWPGDRAVLMLRASRGVTVVSPPDGALAITAGLRQGLVAAVAGLPGPGAGLVPGLAVGDTSAVEPALDAAMKRSSLSHLTAVSGANCALVVGLAFAGAAALGAGRRLRVVVGLAALAGFVLLVTPEPSVVRAGAMAAIAMIGLLLGRTGIGVAVLSLAIVVLLITDPWLAGSLGFALSAAATASLLLFARPLATGLERWLPRSLALGLSIPLAAQLACGPLLVLIEPSVPLYGVVANLLAAPAAPVATVVGLAACLASPIPLLQAGLAGIAWIPASWIAVTATTVTHLPGDLVPWTPGWPGFALLAVVGLAIGLVVAVPRRRARTRVVAGLVVALTIGVVGGGAALAGVAGRLTIPGDWSVIACDVGQGDAVLLRSAGAVALVDTGPEAGPLRACLDRVGVDRIQLLVLTHFDLDHVGGLDAVRGRVDVVLHGPTASPSDAQLLAALSAGGARMVSAEEGMQGALGAAQWRVLWPRAQSRAFPSGNDASVVLDVRGGGVPTTLLLGDLSASPQAVLTASLVPPYALVKVAHHGSADQDAGLYAAASPAIALVTVGADNDYGHPRGEILDVLTAVGARIARTDVDGLVAISTAPEGMTLWREHGRPVGAAR